MRPRGLPPFKLTDIFKAGQQGLLWMPESHRAVLAARKNLLTYSEDFANAAWIRVNGTVTVDSNGFVAPVGTQTADRVSATGVYNLIAQNIAYQSSLNYTVSVYIRKTTGTQPSHPLLQVVTGSGPTTQIGVILQTTTGVASVVTGSGYIAPVSTAVADAGDYWRLIVTVAPVNLFQIQLYPAASANGTTLVGLTSGSAVFWGAQVELGPAATSYQRVTTESDYDWSLVNPGATPTLFQDAAGINAGAIEQPTGLLLDTRLGLPLGPERNPGLGFGTWQVLSGAWTLASATATGAAAEGFIYISGAQPETRGCYEVSGVITGYSAGSIYVSVTNGTQDSRLVSGNGPFTVRCYDNSGDPNSVLYIRGNAFTGTISNLSIRQVLGNHAAQSTSAARPALTARKNLLTYSEDFANAAWTKNGATIVQDGTLSPLGRPASKFVESANNEEHRNFIVVSPIVVGATQTFTFSVYLKAAGRTTVEIVETLRGGGTVNLATGATTGAASAQSVGDGWYRVSVTHTFVPSSNFIVWQIRPIFGSSHIYAGDGASGFYEFGAQCELAPAATPYQRVTTAADYDWQSSYLALNFDGLDDGMSSNFAVGTFGTSMDAWVVCSLAAGEESAVLVDDPIVGGSRYFGTLQSGSSLRQRADGAATANASFSVNGVLAGGTENPTRAEIYTAVTSVSRAIVQATNLDLSAFYGIRIGNYAGNGSGFGFQGRHFAVLICPAQTDANRTKIRKALAKQFGIQGVV